MAEPIKNYYLKIIFAIHFIFIGLSTMGAWAPTSYLFYNSILIVLLLWGLHSNESEEPIHMALIVNILSIVMDILNLVFSYPSGEYARAREKFSAAMAILFLIARPFTSMFLLKLSQERGGGIGFLGDVFTRQNPSSYEDLDRNSAGPSGDAYGYENAQRI